MIIKNDYLSLEQIADSGQVFRWQKLEDGRYKILSADKMVIAYQQGNEVTIDSEDSYWENYLILQTDYKKIIDSIDSFDTYLSEAAKVGRGIRILRQDFWEMLVSFIISQNNNIPRIKKTIERLCESFGQEKDGYYAFPTREELLDKDLSDMGLGYRQKYLEKLIIEYPGIDFTNHHKALLSIVGVGEKVASCVELFGLHDLSAFPVDTWMKKVQINQYKGNFSLEHYKEFAGVIQQYLFYYIRREEGKL
ncbi:hypothetical protein P261_02196 [Lachnospiraceae bacterium TWA4]|nr:hypothetical protein P261_02196 [Lachnospiraceae bacterium TWA4]